MAHPHFLLPAPRLGLAHFNPGLLQIKSPTSRIPPRIPLPTPLLISTLTSLPISTPPPTRHCPPQVRVKKVRRHPGRTGTDSESVAGPEDVGLEEEP